MLYFRNVIFNCTNARPSDDISCATYIRWLLHSYSVVWWIRRLKADDADRWWRGGSGVVGWIACVGCVGSIVSECIPCVTCIQCRYVALRIDWIFHFNTNCVGTSWLITTAETAAATVAIIYSVVIFSYRIRCDCVVTSVFTASAQYFNKPIR